MWADIAHIAGLVGGGGAPFSRFPHCQVVTTTTHKTLRGPRGGLILTDDEALAKKFNSAVFPGSQGGPLMHIIAAKAVAFGEDLKPEFKTYSRADCEERASGSPKELTDSAAISSPAAGRTIISVLIDLRPTDADLSGKVASGWLEQVGIIANMNSVPNETRSPFQTSGVRLGTPALTTRGFKEDDIAKVVDIMDRTFRSKGDAAVIATARQDVLALCERFPMPH